MLVRAVLLAPAAARRCMSSKKGGKRRRNAALMTPKRRGGKPTSTVNEIADLPITKVHPNLRPGPPVQGPGSFVKLVGAATLTAVVAWIGSDYIFPESGEAGGGQEGGEGAPDSSYFAKSPFKAGTTAAPAKSAPKRAPTEEAGTQEVAETPAPAVEATVPPAVTAAAASAAAVENESPGYRRFLLFGPRDAARYWSGEKKAK